jgi:hypothetical protein
MASAATLFVSSHSGNQLLSLLFKKTDFCGKFIEFTFGMTFEIGLKSIMFSS